jgi:hypothetical protein
MKNLMLALAAMLFGYSASSQDTNNLLDNYIAVKNALVSGDNKAASLAVIALQQSIKEDGGFAQKGALLKATEAMIKAGTIDKQRAAFNDVSTILWKIVKGSKQPNEPVYYQYCPMKQAYWLSKEKEIKNPYYGVAMLTCGTVVENK